MKIFTLLAVLVMCAMPDMSVAAATDDIVLNKIIQAYQVKPLRPERRPLGPRAVLGQALFFDPIVSGPRRIACAACHVRKKGSGDNLRLAVGLGATGVSTERLATKDAFVVPRNTLPFFNRGSEEFVALFWDGRIQRGANNEIETPLGSKLPRGFESLLAAAAVFPLAEPDEMLGRALSRSTRMTYHHDLVKAVGRIEDDFQERTLAVFENLIKRLVGTESSAPSPVQDAYRKLFAKAYPGTPVDGVGIAHVGNALAAYIGAAFELEKAQWDRYVDGDVSALSPLQKKGAVVFFGKGRCVVCHSGRQFSDFGFHGLAVPQLGVGKHTRHIDYGRAGATSRGEDRFLFRTPPLRNVLETGPWGHSGVFSSVWVAIEHHVNPVPILYEVQKIDPGERAHAGRLLSFRSPILAEMPPLTDEDIDLLVEFLKALSSKTVMSDDVAIPESVPSGSREFLQ